MMMGRTLSSHVMYTSSLGNLIQKCRTFAPNPAAAFTTVVVFDSSAVDKVQSRSLMDPHVSRALFGPDNVDFPLPGNTATDFHYVNELGKRRIGHAIAKGCRQAKKEFGPPTSLSKNLIPSEKLREAVAETMGKDPLPDYYDVSRLASLEVEFAAYDCPALVRKEFADLFPERSLHDMSTVTVLTLTQKTKHDMSSWSANVEAEREKLTYEFIRAAEAICSVLKADKNYWADFIDPASGRPYLGAFTNSTLFETDERYRHFGFSIEDLGCCKVVTHSIWGTHCFVGCIFTDAPINSPILKAILAENETMGISKCEAPVKVADVEVAIVPE